ARGRLAWFVRRHSCSALPSRLHLSLSLALVVATRSLPLSYPLESPCISTTSTPRANGCSSLEASHIASWHSGFRIIDVVGISLSRRLLPWASRYVRGSSISNSWKLAFSRTRAKSCSRGRQLLQSMRFFGSRMAPNLSLKGTPCRRHFVSAVSSPLSFVR